MPKLESVAASARTLAQVVTALLLVASTVPALAAPKRAQPPRKPSHSLQDVSRMLAAADDDTLRSGLEGAAQLPPRQVLPLVEDRVRAGLPPGLLDVAMDTIQLLSDPAAEPILRTLSRHRRAAVRKRALEVLSQLKLASAEKALIAGLRDPDNDVRAAAATGLGEMGAHGSFDELLQAQQRGVPGSPVALGRVARGEQVDRLTARIGEVPLEVVGPVCEAVFARTDLPEADKLKIAEKLTELQSDEARALRDALLAKLPSGASQRLRRALASEAAKGTTP